MVHRPVKAHKLQVDFAEAFRTTPGKLFTRHKHQLKVPYKNFFQHWETTGHLGLVNSLSTGARVGSKLPEPEGITSYVSCQSGPTFGL